jgi:hypothetical protein
MKLENVGPIERLTHPDHNKGAYCHVLFNAERGQLVATNGHSLIVMSCVPEAGDVSGLISTEAIEQWRAFRRETRLPNSVAFRALEKELVIEDLTSKKKFSYPRPTGQFPAWEQLVPKMKDGTPPTISFNPDVLREIVKAMPDPEIQNEKDKAKSISIWILPQHSRLRHEKEPVPALMVKGTYNGAMAIMMPVLFEGEGKVEWTTRPPQAVIEPSKSDPTPTTQEVESTPPQAANEPSQEAPEATPKGKKSRKKKPEVAAVPAPNGHDPSATHVA